MSGQACPTAARELALYAVNTGELYARRARPIIDCLARKVARGTYDAAKAPIIWRHFADDAARAYSREFGSGERLFSVATRALAATEIADHYSEELAEVAADLKRDSELRRTWTLSAIRAANRKAGSHFFDRPTMRFFGDTMASFAVRVEGGAVYLERVRPCGFIDSSGQGYRVRSSVGFRWQFNPETGAL